jgi:hypothetical protein
MTLGALSREEPSAGCSGRAEKAQTKARRSAQLVRFADSKSAAMLADPVRPSEQQSRDNKHHMNPNEPGKPLGIQVRIKVHKGLEHLDRRNGNNRGQDFLLEPGEIYVRHPLGPIRMTGWIDAGHKVFVTREHHDHHQIGGKRDIDKRQYAQNYIGLAGTPGVNNKLVEDAKKTLAAAPAS